MGEHEEKNAREWVVSELRNGTSVSALHGLVDSVAHGVLCNALEAERRERHRADQAEAANGKLSDELAQINAGLDAIAKSREEGSRG